MADRAAIGIDELDSVLNGGMPRGRIMLIEGLAGTGKSILSMQALLCGGRAAGERGVFVTFEETREELIADMRGMGWDLEAAERDGTLCIIDFKTDPDTIRSGTFDLAGLLAIVDAKIEAIGARRVVFDSLDLITYLIGDHALEKLEYYRLKRWVRARNVSCIVTSKPQRVLGGHGEERASVFLQHLSDTCIALRREVIDRTPVHTLDFFKHRGGPTAKAVMPFLFAKEGLRVAEPPPMHRSNPPVSGRIGTGSAELDAMLEGGYPAGTSILISGAPGTAKTLISLSTLLQAVEDGERALFISFDEAPEQITRNAKSIGFDLQPHLDSGALVIQSLYGQANSVEETVIKVVDTFKQVQPHVVAIDPVSALMSAPGRVHPMSPAHRILDHAKRKGATVMLTTVTENYHFRAAPDTTAEVSSVSDTWIHLGFVNRSAERNRSLAVLKSRGTAHSPRVRALQLSKKGISLSDAVPAEGDR